MKLTPPKNLPCPPLDYSELDLFTGSDFVINDWIHIHQPTIRQIRDEYGDRKYSSLVQTLCTIPSDIKAELHDIGISYMTISDFELFFLMTRYVGTDYTRILFGDLDFGRMEPGVREENGDFVMKDPKTGHVLDRILYTKTVTALRKMHGLEYKPEYATNTYTANALIQEAITKRTHRQKHPQPYQSYLGKMIISLCCTEEFKYNSQSVLDIHICELVMSYEQIIKKKNAVALLSGAYSGNMDVSKINKSEFSWVFDGAKSTGEMPAN